MNVAANSDMSHQRTIDDRLAPSMFILAILFLVLLAALIVVHVDIPRVVELSVLESSTETASANALKTLAFAEYSANFLFYSLLCLWPFFILETVYHATQAKRTGTTKKLMLMRIAAAFIPPLRLGTPSAAWQGRLWLPVLDWQYPGKPLTRALTHFFGKPMC